MLKGVKVIIPKSMQKSVIEQIHQKSHLGNNKCINRLKDVFFWSIMSAQIKDTIRQCTICNEFRGAQQKEPMIPYELPTKPWEICATALFELDRETYIVIADNYSKFFEVKIMNSCSSKTVINVLKEAYSRHGIPVILKSDNGPAYSSMEFKDFAKNYGSEHVTSSPRYSQAWVSLQRMFKYVKSDEKDNEKQQ